jgi:hypothetical protein
VPRRDKYSYDLADVKGNFFFFIEEGWTEGLFLANQSGVMVRRRGGEVCGKRKKKAFSGPAPFRHLFPVVAGIKQLPIVAADNLLLLVEFVANQAIDFLFGADDVAQGVFKGSEGAASVVGFDEVAPPQVIEDLVCEMRDAIL